MFRTGRTSGGGSPVPTKDSGYPTWSIYGAQRAQPVATRGKWEGAENGSNGPIGNRWQPTATVSERMVRRGSTVRVRQRALQNRRTSALSRSGRLAPTRTCGGYGAVYGAFALARPYSLTGECGSDLIEFEAECGCAGDSDGEAKREDAGADEREVTLKRLLLIYSEAWDLRRRRKC
jgi:hypothetical protein